jgi:RNA polymerase sigma factor (sigma-70 family)
VVQLYFDDAIHHGSSALLSHDQEIQLAKAIEAGQKAAARLSSRRPTNGRTDALEDEVRTGQNARERLITANLRLVVSVASWYRTSSIPLADLIQEGNIGLMHAADKYDWRRGTRFSTYAVWWIRQAILHALSQHGATFRLPQKQANVLYRIERSRQALGRELERPPTESELAEELDMSPEEVRLLLSSNQSILSLNEPVDEDGEAELGDLLEQYLMPNTDDRVFRESFEQALREALSKLSAKEHQVVAMRFGLEDDNPLTLREIGEQLGISRERVRQIENQALTKLRRSSQVRALAGYLN